MGRHHRAFVGVVAGLIIIVSSCTSESPESGAPPQTGSGASEQDLGDAAGETLGRQTGKFILKELTAGVLQGIGAAGFNWVLSMVDPDPTQEKLDSIQKGVDELERDVQQLTTDVQSLRGEVDQHFTVEQGVILDASLKGDRDAIDDASLDLMHFVEDTQSALDKNEPLPDLQSYVGKYGDPRTASDLQNLLEHRMHAALTTGGSPTGGGGLIATADAIFADQQTAADTAKSGPAFDDRPKWQRLGLPDTATADDVNKACDDLHTQQPASSICVTKDASGNVVPTVNYYDRMRAFTDYYINYQVIGLHVLVTALYSWDDGGNCPVPAEGECAIAATRAQEITTTVVNNVRTQIAMAGAPVSTSERVLERTNEASPRMWRTTTTPATFSQTPPPPPPAGQPTWWVPLDCSRSGAVGETNFPDKGIPCAQNDSPYTVQVESERAEDQICVGNPTVGQQVAAKAPNVNGVFDAVPTEWARCVRPEQFANAESSGLRLPTHLEMSTALAKNPENWIVNLANEDPTFGESNYLSYTPAQVVCGYLVDGDGESYDVTPVNVNFDRWINGWAETWRKAPTWQGSHQFAWETPLVFNQGTNGFEATAGYPGGGPCQRMAVIFGGGGGNTAIIRGFTQCTLNDIFSHDWCYGPSNYKGRSLPAADSDLRAWAASSVAACPQQQPDPNTGGRLAAWQIDGCGDGTRPTGKDWEVPACKTPRGQWTICGDDWVDELLPPPPPAVPPATTTTTTSTTAAPQPAETP